MSPERHDLQVPTFNKYQSVVICDLDGVLAKNPDAAFGKTQSDPMFWHHHWDEWDKTEPHHEMVNMIRTLAQGGMKIVVLTARPDSYRYQTERFLAKHGVRCSLIMRASDGQIVPSSEWKHDVIEHMVALGYDIKFMIEDYKPNVEAVRSLIPVLLYERKK